MDKRRNAALIAARHVKESLRPEVSAYWKWLARARKTSAVKFKIQDSIPPIPCASRLSGSAICLGLLLLLQLQLCVHSRAIPGPAVSRNLALSFTSNLILACIYPTSSTEYDGRRHRQRRGSSWKA